MYSEYILQACNQDFSLGGGGGFAYPSNWDQTINVGILGHASAKDTKILGRFEDIIPWKNFEILHPQKAGNVLKLSILLSSL